MLTGAAAIHTAAPHLHTPLSPTLPRTVSPHPHAEVLLQVRDEVLRQLGAQLPPEMQLLEAAVAAPDALAREALLARHARLSTDAAASSATDSGSSGGSSSGSSISGGSQAGSEGGSAGGGTASLDCLAVDLERAASQVISDMELMPAIPDRCALSCTDAASKPGRGSQWRASGVECVRMLGVLPADCLPTLPARPPSRFCGLPFRRKE